MVELTRTVRFCLNGPVNGDQAPPRHNGFAAWPPMRGLGRFYQMHVRCRGEVDPVTGYFINIKQIDQAVRATGLPFLERIIQESPDTSLIAMGTLMRRLVDSLQPVLDQSVVQVRLDLTPFYNLTIGNRDMDHVIVRQQFDFSAAHRLHVDELSDEENREVFGKCNNPSGHGHNYRLEVALRAPVRDDGQVLNVEDIDALVDDVVIEKLDHKNLNVDVPQFEGLNPSVENIAKVIYEMLTPVIGDELSLEEVSVWETEKTMCTYSGPGAKVVAQA